MHGFVGTAFEDSNGEFRKKKKEKRMREEIDLDPTALTRLLIIANTLLSDLSTRNTISRPHQSAFAQLARADENRSGVVEGLWCCSTTVQASRFMLPFQPFPQRDGTDVRIPAASAHR